MRAKVVIPAGLIAAAIVALSGYFHWRPEPPSAPAEAVETAAPAPAPSVALSPIVQRAQVRPREALPARPDESSFASSHEDYSLKRRAELIDMGSGGDPAALPRILAELENPDPEIRQTALTATLDFGSKDAIPTLQSELNWATDLHEKVALQNAIEFLQLPRFGEAETTAAAR